MTKEIIIFACGIHSILFAVFHIAFWRLFKWRTELKKLTLVNSAIMQISNILLIYIFLFTAFLCFYFNEELYTTTLGKVIMTGMSIFWIIRTIEQFIFLPLNNRFVHLLTIMFIAGAILFLLPVIL